MVLVLLFTLAGRGCVVCSGCSILDQLGLMGSSNTHEHEHHGYISMVFEHQVCLKTLAQGHALRHSVGFCCDREIFGEHKLQVDAMLLQSSSSSTA